jgi:hypothetical protein
MLGELGKDIKEALKVVVRGRHHNLLPIVAELKIGADKPTYFALIQALMYATEFSSPSQRARLAATCPEAKFTMPADGPFLDVYLIAFKPPSTRRLPAAIIRSNEAAQRKAHRRSPREQHHPPDRLHRGGSRGSRFVFASPFAFAATA